MKLNINIDIERNLVKGHFRNNPTIYLRFTYCTYEEFYEWLDKNTERLTKICNKWNWSYDVGYGDQGIKISKN